MTASSAELANSECPDGAITEVDGYYVIDPAKCKDCGFLLGCLPYRFHLAPTCTKISQDLQRLSKSILDSLHACNYVYNERPLRG